MGGGVVAKKFVALSASFCSDSNALPWKALVPERVDIVASRRAMHAGLTLRDAWGAWVAACMLAARPARLHTVFRAGRRSLRRRGGAERRLLRGVCPWKGGKKKKVAEHWRAPKTHH